MTTDVCAALVELEETEVPGLKPATASVQWLITRTTAQPQSSDLSLALWHSHNPVTYHLHYGAAAVHICHESLCPEHQDYTTRWHDTGVFVTFFWQSCNKQTTTEPQNTMQHVAHCPVSATQAPLSPNQQGLTAQFTTNLYLTWHLYSLGQAEYMTRILYKNEQRSIAESTVNFTHIRK